MAISFQAKGNKSKAVTDSLFIDNIYLQDTSEVEKDQPDMEIMDPVIPTVTFTEAEITVTNPLQEKAMKYLEEVEAMDNNHLGARQFRTLITASL